MDIITNISQNMMANKELLRALCKPHGLERAVAINEWIFESDSGSNKTLKGSINPTDADFRPIHKYAIINLEWIWKSTNRRSKTSNKGLNSRKNFKNKRKKSSISKKKLKNLKKKNKKSKNIEEKKEKKERRRGDDYEYDDHIESEKWQKWWVSLNFRVRRKFSFHLTIIL